MGHRLTPLIEEPRIRERIGALADEISNDFRSADLVLVGVLKGAFVFLADLMRALSIPASVDFLRVASYGTSTETTGVVEIRKDLELSVTGRDVLVVEDIIDTGLTLAYLKKHLLARQPSSLRVCALLDKPSRRKVDLQADYVGFAIEDHFVVGYGLDWDERYRTLPAIHCVIQHADDRCATG